VLFWSMARDSLAWSTGTDPGAGRQALCGSNGSSYPLDARTKGESA
jgi:hypothetical protein